MNDFGICEEPVSRAFWGSEDLEDDPIVPTFTLEWLTNSPDKIKTLIVVAGQIVTDIANKFVVGNADRICTVNSSEEFNVAAVYKLSDDTYICAVNGSVDLPSTGRLVDTISELALKSEKIIAFTDDKISHLIGSEAESAIGPTLWRSLSTRKAREDRLSKMPSLKYPNFIAGVAGGVIGYAEIMDIPATVYILYITDDAYVREMVEPVMKLFTEVTDSSLPKVDPDSKIFNDAKLKLYI